MGISYKRYRYKLAEHNIKPIDISKETGLNPSVFTKINQDKYVNISTLEIICKFFRDKYNDNCDFGDLIEYVDDSTKE